MGFCVPVRRTNALCSWIAFISLIQMDKTLKDITGTSGRNDNYYWIKELSILQYSILKAVYSLGRLFRFGFYSVILNAEPRTPLWKRRKWRSSQQLPLYRDSRDTEECSEHPSSCHWQSCKNLSKMSSQYIHQQNSFPLYLLVQVEHMKTLAVHILQLWFH